MKDFQLGRLTQREIVEFKREMQKAFQYGYEIEFGRCDVPILPEEDIDQIWNKFYKVDKARTREYGGNGIGLSIVKAIMQSMQKGYGVKNYNNGVLFWFELDAK